MADTKISALTTDSSPDRTADFVPVYDASAAATKKVLLGLLGAQYLTAEFTSTNPADGTTYYFGAWGSLPLQSTGGGQRVYVARACIVTACDVYFAGVAGTSETSTLSLRVNNTTDNTITSALNLSSPPVHSLVTGLNVALSAGDYFEIKWVTPTWVTNPTSLYGRVTVYLS